MSVLISVNYLPYNIAGRLKSHFSGDGRPGFFGYFFINGMEIIIINGDFK